MANGEAIWRRAKGEPVRSSDSLSLLRRERWLCGAAGSGTRGERGQRRTDRDRRQLNGTAISTGAGVAIRR
jgi:hypothetical protein